MTIEFFRASKAELRKMCFRLQEERDVLKLKCHALQLRVESQAGIIASLQKKLAVAAAAR